MLERRLSALLAEHLQHFIKNLNEEQLRVSLWSGELVLHNLALRPDILDQIMMLIFRAGQTVKAESFSDSAAAKALLLPFTVVVGVIKTLRVVVPWSSLDRDSFKVIVEGVEIVLGPLRARPYSEDEEVNRSAAIKKKQSEMFEKARQTSSVEQQDQQHEAKSKGGSLPSSRATSPRAETVTAAAPTPVEDGAVSPTPSAAKQSYADQIISSVVKNAHVMLRDINISYTFDYVGLHPSLASAILLHIGELYFSTNDEKWTGKPTQQNDTAAPGVQSRYITVKDFSLALKSKRSGEFSSTTPAVWMNHLNIVNSCDLNIFLKIASPADATVASSLAGATQLSDHIVEVQVSNLSLQASLDAVQILADVAKSLSQALDCTVYRKHLHLLLEPDSPTRGHRGQARARWRFCLAGVKSFLAEQRRDLSWSSIREFCVTRREYIGLYKRHQHVSWLPELTPHEVTHLEALERKLRIDQLVLLRCLAYAELAVDQSANMTQQALLGQKSEPQRRSGSWMSWLGYGRSKQPAAPIVLLAATTATFSVEEQRSMFVTNFLAEWLIACQYLQSKHKIQQLPDQTERQQGFQISVDIERVHLRIAPAHTFEPRPFSADSKSQLLWRLKRLLTSVKAELNVELQAAGGNFRLASTIDVEVPHHNVLMEVGKASAAFSTNGRAVTVVSMRDTSDVDATTSPWLSVGSDSRRIDVLVSNCSVMLPLLHELEWWGMLVRESLACLSRDEAPQKDSISKGVFQPVHVVIVNSCVGIPFSDPSLGAVGATIERAAVAVSSATDVQVEVSSSYVDMWTATSIHRACQFDDVAVAVVIDPVSNRTSVEIDFAEEVSATIDPHMLGVIADRLLRPIASRFAGAKQTAVGLDIVALHAQPQLGGNLITENVIGQPTGATFDPASVEEERSIIAGVFDAQKSLSGASETENNPSADAPVAVSVRARRGALVTVLTVGSESDNPCMLRICGRSDSVEIEEADSPLTIVVTSAAKQSTAEVMISEVRMFSSSSSSSTTPDCLLALSDVRVTVHGDEVKQDTNVRVALRKAHASVSPPLIGAAESILGLLATIRPKSSELMSSSVATQAIRIEAAEASVQCLRTNPNTRRVEPLLVALVTSATITVIDSKDSSDVTVLTVISAVERLDSDGKRFDVLFPHSSGEPTLLKVVVSKPLEQPPQAQFASRVSVQLLNVSMAHYHAFLLRAADLSSDPIVDRLTRISELQQSITGFSSITSQLRNKDDSCGTPPQLTGIEVVVSNIEIFAAVDAYQQVAPGDLWTHVPLRVPKVTVKNAISATVDGFKFLSTSVLVSAVEVPTSPGTFSSAVENVHVVVTAGLLCVADGDSYVLKPGASPAESTVRVQLGDFYPDAERATVNMSISHLLLEKLLRVVAFNVLDPIAAAKDLQECGFVPARQSAQVLMLTIPSLRAVIYDDVAIFDVVLSGLQVYRATGGSVWHTSPLQSVKLQALNVVDRSPMSPMMERDLPKASQKQRLAPCSPKSIVSVSSVDIVIQGERDPQNMAPSTSEITVTVGDVHAALLPASIFALRDLIANDVTTPCLAVVNASVPVHPDAPASLPTNVVMHAFVKIALLKADLVEAWGTEIGSITGGDLLIDVHQQISEAQRVDIRLRDFALTQSITDPALQTMVRSLPRSVLRGKEEDGNFPLSISVSIIPPRRQDAADQSSASAQMREAQHSPSSPARPSANFTTFVDLVVDGVDVVLVPHALLRILSLVGEDLVPLSMIMLGPAARAAASVSPSFEAPSLVVEGSNVMVRVPCDCTGKEAAASLTYHSFPSWVLSVPTVHVSNRLSIVPATCAAPLSCWAETLTVRLSACDVSLDGAQSLLKLTRLDSVLVEVERPMHRAAFLTTEVAGLKQISDWRFSASSPSALSPPTSPTTTKLYQIIPPSNLRVGNSLAASFLMKVSITISLSQQCPLHITPRLLQSIVRTTSMTSLIEPIPYYRTGDASVDISVGITVEKFQVHLCSEDQAGGRHTILVLNVRDNITVMTLQPYDPAEAVKTSVAVEGSLDVADYRGTIVMHRTSADRTVGQERSSAIQLSMVDTPSSAASKPAASVSQMELYVRDLRVLLNDNTVDVAVRLQSFLETLNASSPSSVGNPSSAGTSPSSGGTLLVVLQNSRLHITDTALVNVAQASISVPLARSNEELQHESTQSKLQIMVSDVSLSRPGRTQQSFFSVSSAEVKVGVGSIYVKALKPHLINHDTYFFLDLFQAVEGLQEYIAAHAKLSKKSEESFKHTLVISMVDLDFSLVQRSPHDASAARTLQTTTAPPLLTITYPAVVLKLTDTTTAQDFSIEAEDGAMHFINPQVPLPVPPLCKGLAFSMRHSTNEKSASSSVSLGKVTISVPVGTVQQNCTEIVAHALIPLIRFTKRVSHGAPVLSTADTSVAPRRSTSVELFAPQISIYTVDTMQARSTTVPSPLPRMNFSRASPLQGTMDNILFGLEIHQISLEHKANEQGGNETAVFKIYSISSVVNPSIQHDLLSTSDAPGSGGSSDGGSGPAILLRRDVVTAAPDNVQSMTVANDRETVEKRVSFVAKVKTIKATISPVLLKLVNDNILAHVAIAVRNSREHHNQVAFTSPQRLQSSFTSSSSQLAGFQTPCIEISQDYTVKSDLVLGGSSGSWIHFKKVPMDSGKPIDNVISFDGVNHATIYISHFDEYGMYGGPLSSCPIVVDEGLSVYCRNVRFVLQGTGMVLHDYILVGSRSFFCLLDPHLVITPSQQHKQQHQPVHSTVLSIPDTIRRETLELTTVDISIALNISLWSAHQKITVSTAADGAYRVLKSSISGASAPRVVDEGGDISLIDLAIVCDSGNITTEPTGLIVNIRHHRPKEADAKPFTIARCIIPNTRLSISLGHAKLLLDVVTAIQRGSKHISDMDEPFAAGGIREDIMASPKTPSIPTAHQYGRDQRERAQEKVSAEDAVLVQVGVTAPLLELVLTNDFFIPIAVCSIINTSIQLEAERGIDSFALAACLTIQCCDYPLKDALAPRQLLELSPEIAVDFNRFKNNGLAVDAKVAIASVTATVPIVTLLKVLDYEFSKQNTGSYSFRNLTGVYLTLFSAEGDVSNHALYCVVPPDETVKADIFRYDQTVFRIVEGTPDEVGGKNLAAVGAEVDLSRISSTAAVPIHLDQQCNVGVTDIVLKLNEKERLVELTSCVTFHNDLSSSCVTLFYDGGETSIPPQSSFALPLQSLLHSFDIAVGSCTKIVPNPMTVPPSPSLETLLGGLLIASEDIPGAVGRNTIEIPVQLDSGEAERRAPRQTLSLVLQRRTLGTNSSRSVYEVHLRARIRLFNEIGVAIAAAILADSKAAASVSEIHDTTMPRRSNSPLMDSSSQTQPMPMAHLTQIEDRCGYDALEGSSASSSVCGAFLVFNIALPNRMILRTEAPIPMTGAACIAVPVVDNESKRAYMRLEFQGDRYVLRSGVVVVNALKMPIQVLSGDASRALLAGQCIREGLPVNARFPVGFPTAKAALDLNSALPLRIRARDGAQPSLVFSAGVPTLTTMMSCAEGHLVHIFSIKRIVTTPSTPEVLVEPLWHIRNDHSSLAMCLRRVGLEESDLLVPPNTIIPLITFAATNSADPQIQVSFQISGTAMFEWSQTIPLASLAGSSAPVVVKHNFAHPDVRHVPIAMMTALLSPDIPERFCCLNLAMERQGHTMTLHVNVSNEFLPIIIENRTNESISFQQTGQRELYIVRPREDAPFAWSTFAMESRRVTLHLVCPKQKRHQVVLDVFKESASTEVRKIADRLFLNCSHDVARRRIFISIVQDRHLESSFIQQSNVIYNIGFFVRRCSVFVAGPCVSGALKRTQNPVVDALVALEEPVEDADRSKEVVNAHLAAGKAEIDLLLVVIDHFSAKLTTNGNCHLAGASCGSVTVHDCSVPKPLHPVVLRCGVEDSDDLALEVRVHFLSPQIVGEKKAFAFKALQVSVSPVHICLNDALLFVLQEAALSVQQIAHRSDLRPDKESESNSSALSVACHVEKMWISQISLILTLTRRADGEYNPFAVIPLGNLFVQSVEAAPITLGEIVAVDALKSASSVADALTQLIVPTYRTHVVMQLYKIIGSLEMLGNPVMFASNVSAGVREFVVQTIHLHPLHGISSLFSAATSGALHSVALLSRIGGRTIATVSFDGEWLSQREQEQTTATRGSRGIISGLASGIASGVAGVVMRPVHGAQSRGFLGFCTGVATGIIGIVGRPLAGTLEGIGNTAESAAAALRYTPATTPPQAGQQQEDAEACSRNFNSQSHLRVHTKAAMAGAAPSSKQVSTGTARLPSPRQAVASLNELVFCGQSTFAAQRQQLRGDIRKLMDILGSHNIARYAQWNEFAAHATPQEFYDGVHIAIEKVFADMIGHILQHSKAVARSINPQQAMDSQLDDDSSTALRKQQLLVVERIHNIKHSLGTRDLLKYVTVHQFVQFCSLTEIKNCFSLEELQNRIGPFLLESTKEVASSLFPGGAVNTAA